MKAVTTATGDRGTKPSAEPERAGTDPRKPDPESLRPHPTKDDKTSPIDKASDPEPTHGAADTGVTGGDPSASKPGDRAMVLKVSMQGGSHHVTLVSGLEIRAEDIGLETKEFGRAIAHVVDGENGARDIVNDSKKKWKYSEPGSEEEKSLAPKGVVRLKPGLVLKFGNGSKGVVS